MNCVSNEMKCIVENVLFIMIYSFNNDVFFYSVPGHLPKHQPKVCQVNSLGFLHLRLGLYLGTLLAARILALVVARVACSLALGAPLMALAGFSWL